MNKLYNAHCKKNIWIFNWMATPPSVARHDGITMETPRDEESRARRRHPVKKRHNVLPSCIWIFNWMPSPPSVARHAGITIETPGDEGSKARRGHPVIKLHGDLSSCNR
jgi:hypothetical protein